MASGKFPPNGFPPRKGTPLIQKIPAETSALRKIFPSKPPVPPRKIYSREILALGNFSAGKHAPEVICSSLYE